MTNNDVILLLSHHNKIGGQTIKKVMRCFPKMQDAFGCAHASLSKMLGEKIAAYVSEAGEKLDILQIREKLIAKDMGYITLTDKKYPDKLLEIPDHPAILFIRGDFAALNGSAISVVGSRSYTQYGARVARKLTGELVRSGLTVMSGLALGIDAIAHRAAVDNSGLTVGVLGCGVDNIYPVSNQQLALEIINKGGAVISEYPPGTEPYKSNFPARNRIIAGLSMGTLVIEAAKESGALITAMAALDYNRNVYAVPGPIDSISSEGTNYLIQQGAKLTASAEDILADMNLSLEKIQKEVKKVLPISEDEKLVFEIVKDSESHADDIVKKCKLNVAQLTYTLTMLEMKGILENVGGTWRVKT